MLLALVLGLIVGLIMGALGGGGSILTVPLLVFALGLSAQEATSASLVIVGVSAIVASISHGGSGNTRWRTGLLLAAVGVPTAVLGTQLNHAVSPRPLLLGFAGVLLLAATGMLLRGGSEPSTPAVNEEPWDAGTWLRFSMAGLGIGFLTGFFGVGGGFVIVPVLVVLLGLPAAAAIGTSLLVIAVSSAVALIARLGHSSFDWAVIAPFTLTAVGGALAGQRVASRLPAQTLSRAFAVLLVLVAGYVAVRSGSAQG